MRLSAYPNALVLLSLGLAAGSLASGQVKLLAAGSLAQSSAGPNADLSGLTYQLENGAPANLLGGLGSGLAYVSGNTFLALPDRGPNAIPWNPLIDDTVSYINRFHTVAMELLPARTGLPFTLLPHLRNTTLLWSATDLVYGSGRDLNVGSGVPPGNNRLQHFFTGRSDNYDQTFNSGNTADARLDTESIRVSNNGRSVFISDGMARYLPVQSPDRSTDSILPVTGGVLCNGEIAVGATGIASNSFGRTANKGMEGLALTPDGNTLVGIMQNALIQDAQEGGAAASLLRMVTIDIASGVLTHEYAYSLTTGSGVSDILALNNHEFLVDERDGRGREGGSNLTSNDARVKQIFKINLSNAVDITGMDGLTAAQYAVPRTLFLDLVQTLTQNGFNATLDIPSKIEGLAFGPDVTRNNLTWHTLWVANDNDFVLSTNDTPPVPNPNQFFVFGFTAADLGGSTYLPQSAAGSGK